MSDPADLPEPDAVPGLPHPRMAGRVFGHAVAADTVVDAHNAGRMHHGWLITGPRGVGKATFAWAVARFLLASPEPAGTGGLFGADPAPQTLDIDPDHPVARRLRALSEPRLFLLRRGPNEKGDKRAAEIRVGEVRALRGFLGLSAAEGGRRVVIVDDADSLNVQAANAILKLLEEPPARTVFLLIAHQPARLLPTIRSRCRVLRLGPLTPGDMSAALDQAGVAVTAEDADALATIAGGSVGAAARIVAGEGLALYRELLGVLAGAPSLDRPRLIALAESCAGRGSEARLDLTLSLADLLAARAAHAGVAGAAPGVPLAATEPEVLARVAPDARAARRWAAAAAEAGARARHARAVNVDPAALVTDLVLQLARAV
jgi:DNA polymerase-3 subunit delta'